MPMERLEWKRQAIPSVEEDTEQPGTHMPRRECQLVKPRQAGAWGPALERWSACAWTNVSSSNKQRNYVGLKTTACMRSWGKFWAKHQKKTKNPIATSKELGAKIVCWWRRKWQPTPVFLPGKIHGQRSLAGWSPWDYMTEHVCTRVEGDGLVAINW